MIASRGNLTLLFLGIYLIPVFLTIDVISEYKEWSMAKQLALQVAGCMVDCSENVSV